MDAKGKGKMQTYWVVPQMDAVQTILTMASDSEHAEIGERLVSYLSKLQRGKK